MAVPIDLKVSEIDPPTVLMDIVSLPDPVKLGVTVRIFNYDDVTLYFRITGGNAAWTFGTVDLGSIGSGANIYRNLDAFGSRARPTTEIEENIKLILRAYTDSGYTNLKWTYEKGILMKFINSADPSYTVDVLNNFDDGTAQGWAKTDELGYSTEVIATDYVLSTPYSYELHNKGTTPVPGESRTRVYKSFTTPNKDIVYAIFDFRMAYYEPGAYIRTKYLAVDRDTERLIFLGRPYEAVLADYLPPKKWMRVVVPLPKNTTLELRIIVCYSRGPGSSGSDFGYWWMDDFKIISKTL